MFEFFSKIGILSSGSYDQDFGICALVCNPKKRDTNKTKKDVFKFNLNILPLLSIKSLKVYIIEGKRMNVLIISHYIYLNREQRYELHSGKKIEVVGISIPVWFNKGTTSEPAKELFCKYQITNEPKEKEITPFEEGYIINLPQKPDLDEQEMNLYFSVETKTSENLLDIKDGGSEELEFKQYSKIKKDNKEFNVLHFVEIKTEEVLKNTLS
jgi:hypothetical protein